MNILSDSYFGDGVSFKSCLCFDPFTFAEKCLSHIVDMNYARWEGAILAVNGKLYIFGGLTNSMYSFNSLPKNKVF